MSKTWSNEVEKNPKPKRFHKDQDNVCNDLRRIARMTNKSARVIQNMFETD